MPFKTTILGNPWLYSLIALVSRLLRLRIKGSFGNKIHVSSLYCASGCRIAIKGRANKIVLGESCRFKNVMIEISGDNNVIEIGDKVRFSENGVISVKGDHCAAQIGSLSSFVGSTILFLEESNTSITIGNDCMFGRDVVLSTTDFHSIMDVATQQRINRAEDIVIGSRVWVGTAVHIAKGARIGEDSVVATKSLVNKKFDQSNVILAGMPAKIVKEGITWCREKL